MHVLTSRSRPASDPMTSTAMRNARWAAIAFGALLALVLLTSSELRPVFLSGAGIAQGALIAAIALGVVLTFRGSGVVNLANGALAMYVAYTYAILRAEGDLFLPPLPNPLSLVEGIVHFFQEDDTFLLPDIPTVISFGPNMTFWSALILSLVVCVVLGLVLHFVVFRPLRTAPALAKVVASVGLFLLLQAIVIQRFGIRAVSVRPLPGIDKTQVDLGITQITQEQLFVVVLVIVFTVALWLGFQRTNFGLATRAAAENEKGAIVLGYSPDLLAGVNWVLSTVITGLLGILVASINSNVGPSVIPALIVPAVTAALIGGFSSFGLTTATAFLLGMQIPVIQYLGARADWFPKAGNLAVPGVETVVPLVLIGLVLFLRGNALPSRGDVASTRLPFSPSTPAWARNIAGPLLIGAAAVGALFVFDPSYRAALATTLVGVIICLSVVVVTGFVGQMSLAPMAFAGIGAFTAAWLSTSGNLPFPLPIIGGALVAMFVGLAVALPALRIRGINLAIITIAFGVTMDRFVFANSDVNGGIDLARVATPELIEKTRPSTWELLGFLNVGDGRQPNPMTALFVLVVAALLAYVVINIRRSTTGRQMLAVRSNERAASAAGVNVAATKALAFGLSAFIAGVAGAIIAYRDGSAVASTFSYDQSLLIFAFAYLGGLSRVSGAMIGGLILAGGLGLTVLDDLLASSGDKALLLAGLGLVITAILQPEGIAGGIAHSWDRLRNRGPGDVDEPSPAEPVEVAA